MSTSGDTRLADLSLEEQEAWWLDWNASIGIPRVPAEGES